SSRGRGTARLPTFVVLLLTLFGVVLPGVAQTWVQDMGGVNLPTFLALDANRSIGGTMATWLYVSEHGETTGSPPVGGGRILRFNLTAGGIATVIATRGTADGQFIS